MVSTKLKKQDQGNNGRWKKSEHNKFMKALEKYGRNWVKVQQIVKTRTLAQVRSHAQKTFLKISDADIDAMIAPSDQQSEQEIIRLRKKSHRKNQQSYPRNGPVQNVREEKLQFMNSSNQVGEPEREENQHKDGKIQRNEQQNTYELIQEIRNSQNSPLEECIQPNNADRFSCPFIQLFKENYEYILSGGNFINLLFP